MGTRLTGSALPRARHCAWPYRDDVSYEPRPVGKAADDGTDVHTMMEHYLAGEPVPAMGPRAQLIFEQVKLGIQPPALPEPAFAIDVTTGAARLIGSRLNRNYGELGQDEIALTTDWVRVDGDSVEVGDLKTGYAGHVAHPRENLQLQAAAYAAAKVNGKRLAIAKILIAREDEFVPLFARFDGDWMDGLLVELREIHFRTRLPSPAVPGEHCQYCPALGACPQTQQLALFEGGPKWSTQSISAENDALMVTHLPMLEKAIDAIKDALKQRAPIHLPNGKVWKETFKRMKTLDKQKVEQLLGDRYPECLREIECSGGFRQVKG